MTTGQALIKQLVVRTRSCLKARSGAKDLRKAFWQVVDEVVAEGNGLYRHDGVDVIGKAYEALISSEGRRAEGQFFTPRWAADLMSGWLFREPRQLLLDPGCGSGSLTIAAATHGTRGSAAILALDRDPLAIHMLRANCALRALQNIEMVRGDFLVTDFAARPDAVICNPPYIRHQHIPSDEKRRVHLAIEQRFGFRMSGLAGMPALFLLKCLDIVSPKARLAFVTPAHWLDVDYARPLKELLLESASIEAIILLPERSLLFERILTTAAIILLRTEAPPSSPTTVIRLGNELPPADLVLDALAGDPVDLDSDHITLRADDRWARPTRRRERSFRGVRLAELARIRRGVATGANDFFVVSEAQRKLLHLPIGKLRLCLTSPKLVTGCEVTLAFFSRLADDVPRWLINTDDPGDEDRQTALGRYLRLGRDELRIHERSLPRARRPWFRPEQRNTCDIVFTYLNRERSRFIRNRSGATALNKWLIIEPLQHVDPERLWCALQRPVIHAQLATMARTYARGLWKLEPAELGKVRVDISRAS